MHRLVTYSMLDFFIYVLQFLPRAEDDEVGRFCLKKGKEKEYSLRISFIK